MQNCTADKTKTNKPKNYVKRVCTVLRQLDTLDNIPNPFNHQVMVPPQSSDAEQQPMFMGMPPPYGAMPYPVPYPFDPYGSEHPFMVMSPQHMQPMQQQQQQQQQRPPVPSLYQQQGLVNSPDLKSEGSGPSPRAQGMMSPAAGGGQNRASKLGVATPGMGNELLSKLPNIAPSTDTIRSKGAVLPKAGGTGAGGGQDVKESVVQVMNAPAATAVVPLPLSSDEEEEDENEKVDNDDRPADNDGDSDDDDDEEQQQQQPVLQRKLAGSKEVSADKGKDKMMADDNMDESSDEEEELLEEETSKESVPYVASSSEEEAEKSEEEKEYWDLDGLRKEDSGSNKFTKSLLALAKSAEAVDLKAFTESVDYG